MVLEGGGRVHLEWAVESVQLLQKGPSGSAAVEVGGDGERRGGSRAVRVPGGRTGSRSLEGSQRVSRSQQLFVLGEFQSAAVQNAGPLRSRPIPVTERVQCISLLI